MNLAASNFKLKKKSIYLHFSQYFFLFYAVLSTSRY